jgi:N-acetylglucosaminyl-diphospho-decaprenol L-rhamnosyltransferase
VSLLSSVDVLIVSFNTRALLVDCLNSVFAEASTARSAVNVFVLDNASSDGTLETLSELDTGAHVVASQTNLLYGPAVNRLVANSRADYVLLLNPDTRIPSGTIDGLAGILTRHSEVAMVFPTLSDTEGRFQQASYPFPALAYELAVHLRGTKLASSITRLWDAESTLRFFTEPPLPDAPFEMNLVWSTCVMMRRSEAARYGPFRSTYPMYDTDLDLCRRLGREGKKAYWLSAINVLHVGGASSTSEEKVRMMQTARGMYHKDYGGRLQYVAYLGVTRLIPSLKVAWRKLRGRRLTE